MDKSVSYIGEAPADFKLEVDGLSAGQLYYYRTYVKAKGTGDLESTVKTFTGETKRFNFGTKIPATLEAPATKTGYTYSGFGSGTTRNYNYCFDTDYYASLWVAYPLTEAHTQGSASTSNWKYDPNISNDYQPAITGSKSYGSSYGMTGYSRGHQCPNADRQSDDTMNSQTYYATNQTPQLQSGFNGGIWNSLESAVRGLTTGRSDTLYVATGPCYQTVGGAETVTWYDAQSTTIKPEQVPLPNYYWKAILKIKTVDGYITDACAVGFWFKHEAYSGSKYSDYIVSIDEIEAKTGFDLYAGLPDYLESLIESETPSWTEFQNF